jgi:DNA-directed RNA polymerase specialized sigma24 family protein
MNRYADGSDGAFAELYDALAPELYRYLRERVASDAAAEEILADTFLHVHKSRGTFISGTSVLEWARAIGERFVRERGREAGNYR